MHEQISFGMFAEGSHWGEEQEQGFKVFQSGVLKMTQKGTPSHSDFVQEDYGWANLISIVQVQPRCKKVWFWTWS